MCIIEVAPADKPADATLQPVTGPSLLPTALRDADDELHHLWRDLAATVRHPIARARCWDIVFTSG